MCGICPYSGTMISPAAPGPAQRLRRHEQPVIIDIGEAGSGTSPHHGGGGGDERARGDDNLIARTEAKRGQAELQCVCPVREADGMVRAAVCRHARSKAVTAGPPMYAPSSRHAR